MGDRRRDVQAHQTITLYFALFRDTACKKKGLHAYPRGCFLRLRWAEQGPRRRRDRRIKRESVVLSFDSRSKYFD